MLRARRGASRGFPPIRDAAGQFLLNAVAADEFTQALIAFNLAREAGIERIVYLSVIQTCM